MKELLTTAKVKIMFILLCLCSLAMPVATASAAVVINEIMYHPVSDMDEDEFLELYNTGGAAVDLNSWSIDGIGFTFGPGASIGPGAYIVLANDAARFLAKYGFAPDYVYDGRLSNSGELLRVLDANETEIDSFTYGSLPPWSVTPDGEGPSLERIDPTLSGDTARNWHASTAAAKHTAKAVNSVNAVGLPPWITNVQHGTVQAGIATTVTSFVVDATTVNLTYVINFGTPVTIAMLDDGLSGDGGAGDGVYGATIPAQPVSTLIRYRIDATAATRSMGFPRNDDTVTYTGGYIEDTSVITGLTLFHWLMAQADYDYIVANTADTALARPALLYYNGTVYDVNVHARGATDDRGYAKKHWKFRFPRNHYFYAPELGVVIPADQFNLQSSWTDKSHLREHLAWRLFGDVGHPYSLTSEVRVQLNGQFYGLYTYMEQPDDDFLERNGLDKDGGAYYEAYPGDSSDCRYFAKATLPSWYVKSRPKNTLNDFNDLYDFLYGINQLTGDARRNFIFDNVDIPRMLNYWAAIIVMHENDSVAKNYYLYRDSAGTKRWFMTPWDKDLTWGRNWYSSGGVNNDEIWANRDSLPADHISGTGAASLVSPSHPLFGEQEHEKSDHLWNRLIDALFNETDIRNMYLRRLRTVMDEQLQPPGTPYEQLKLEEHIDDLVAVADTEAAMDLAKWGSWGTIQTMSQASQIMKDSYLAVRRTHLYTTHSKDANAAGEIPTAQTPELPIIINEIMYNPTGGDANEFIELYNPSSTESVDLSDWELDGVALRFPPGTVLLPQKYLVVVKNDVQFRATYGSGKFVAAQYTGSLDNGGENLVLKDRQGNVIDEVRYDDDAPWPTSPDAGGKSLELIDISQNNNRPVNWAASASTGGTPGASNSMAGTAPSVPDLWVNELLLFNGSINTDEKGEYEPWIEIYNASASSINLGGMFLTNDYNNPTKWAIPADTVLDSNEWMIFWADAEPNDGPLHTNFALNAAGGSVGLYTSAGNIVDYLNYDPLPTDISYGEYPDGTPLRREFVTPTPAARNHIIPRPVILNEYNAVADSMRLKDDGSDTFWGQVLGNGGDWFELVVIQDHLDMRGWKLEISDDTGGAGHTTQTLTLTNNNIWSDLRSGTIITVSENLPDDISNYDPAGGYWWINAQARTGASGTYITAASFKVTNNNWQLTIRDSSSTVVFGPAGEGIKPITGIGNDEVLKLEEDPGPYITERANYNDGTSSTFGSENIYADGTMVQDFSGLRNIPDTRPPTPDAMTWKTPPTATESTSITMIATTASDPCGVEYYFDCLTAGGHDSNGWQNSPYYKDKNLQLGTTYSYQVKAHDKSAAQNETGWSGTGSAIPTITTTVPTFQAAGTAVSGAAAAPTYQAAGTAVSGTGAVTPTWPTHQAGDIALLFVEAAGGDAISLTTANGFVQVPNSPQATGTGTAGTRIAVYWCRATSSSMSAPVLADSGDHTYARILTFRGVIATGDPWDATGGGVKATASTSVTATGVTTTVANTLVVVGVTKDLDATAAFASAWANANLASITEQTDGGTTSGGGGGHAVMTGTKATAGATGNTTATVTSSINAFLTIALKPVTATGAITPAWPTHQVNDIALLVVETANQAVTLSTPAGFVEVTNSPQGTGTAAGTAATRLAVYWKRAASSAESAPTVDNSGDHQIARIITFRGVTTSGNPWDVTAGNVASTASTSVSIPAQQPRLQTHSL